MREQDNLQRFIFEHAQIRGELIHLDAVFETIVSQQNYPAEIKHLLGEALVACILLVSSIKFEGEISLQFQGDECLSLLLVHCDHHLNVRACVKFQEGKSAGEYERAFLNGKMALMLSPFKQTQVYQSVVSIRSASMAENLMYYFAQSEQIATKVWLAVGESSAAGFLLQLMPDIATEEREQFWEYAVKIGETITDNELLTLDHETILYRLYHEAVLRLFSPRIIRFKCRCSNEKMREILKVLGEEEVNQLLQEQSHVTVTCDFCHKNFSYDAIDVALLFRDL